MRNSSALMLVIALCWSCEFSRNTSQEIPQPDQPRPAGQVDGAKNEPKREEEPPAPAKPTSKEPPSEPSVDPAPAQEPPTAPLRRIDGRRSAPRATSGTPVPHDTVRYAFGQRPKALSVPAESLVIAPRAAGADRVAGVEEPPQDPIVMELHDPLLEVALIEKGRRVLDRKALSLIEHEHVFQFGHAEAGLAEKMGGAVHTSSPTAERENGLLTQLTLGDPLVGREPYFSYLGPLWWLFDGNQARPLLNGNQVASADRLREDAFLSAKTILVHEALEVRESTLVAQSRRPSASSIPHLPILGQGVLDPNARGSDEWSSSPSDPFHYTNSGNLILFDPVRNSLWKLRDAWIGRVVSRTSYIEARTNDVVEVCPECGAKHTERVKPDSSELPTKWRCESCKESHTVVYLDGYRMEGDPQPDASTILHAEWISAAPGIYPLARTVAPGGDLTSGIVLPEAPTTVAEMRAASLRALASRYQRGFCWVRNDGSAVIVTPEELEKLNSASGIKGWPEPILDPEGRQTFALAQEPYETTQVEIPISSAGIRFRAIDVSSGLVVLAGTIQRSFLEVLPSPLSLPVGTGGADMSSWPSGPAQAAAIRHAIVELLASRFGR